MDIVERAFDLARSGSCRSVTDVKKQLKRFGFTDGQIEYQMIGAHLRKQLTALCREANIEPIGSAPRPADRRVT